LEKIGIFPTQIDGVPVLVNMESLEHLRKPLLQWYAGAKRTLPWREQPSLYGTVVSEFMLQQTQISTALPYYQRWLEAFPDFSSLAAASEAEVLKQWEGLGYYSRARNLHALAREVVKNGTPESYAHWLALPGVGPYTAAAIVSIALGMAHAVVDGNVVRVLARLYAIDTEFAASGSAVKAITPLADALLCKEHPGDFNQALMELGATVCTKTKPNCMSCPWLPYCQAAQSRDTVMYPRIKRKPTVRRSVQRIWLKTDNGILLQKSADTDKRLAGHYELPAAENCREFVRIPKRAWLTKKRGIANEMICENIYQATMNTRAKPTAQLLKTRRLQWIPLTQLEIIQISGPHRRWIQEILLAR
jgi:A/G-specific adenine glycosylase